MRTVLICCFGLSLVTSSQKESPLSPATVLACHEFSFEGRVNGGQEYVRELGEGLRLRLFPFSGGQDKNSGWIIEVQPVDADDDYAFPVNPPFHSGNSQWLASGYGETAEEQLKHEHEVFFVLNRNEYERARKAVDDALSSKDTLAAERFLKALPELQSAALRLKPIKYETSNAGQEVSWMNFSVTVTTPASFHPASNLAVKQAVCPSAHP
jgi:hypothetical protein